MTTPRGCIHREFVKVGVPSMSCHRSPYWEVLVEGSDPNLKTGYAVCRVHLEAQLFEVHNDPNLAVHEVRVLEVPCSSERVTIGIIGGNRVVTASCTLLDEHSGTHHYDVTVTPAGADLTFTCDCSDITRGDN